MSNLNKIIEELDMQIKELEGLKNQAKLPSVQTFLQNEINRLMVSKQNFEKEKAKAIDVGGGDPGKIITKDCRGTITITNYMWDQSNDYIKIYIELKKEDSIDSSEISLQFDSGTKFICIFGKYRFTLGRLYAEIDQEKSKAIITKSNRLVITLYKVKSENWPSLQKDSRAEDFKKDIDPTEDPEKNLMSLMKKMYDEGDDEMKRMIGKTMYESRQSKMMQ